MTATQRKAIFGLKTKLGMDNEELHCLVYGVTGCGSLKELTDRRVMLSGNWTAAGRTGTGTSPPEERNPKAYRPAVPGMMTTEQQSLAWRLIYRLK